MKVLQITPMYMYFAMSVCMWCMLKFLYPCSSPEGVVQAPPKKMIERLLSDIKRWQDVINKEAENFTGDILIGRQEEIKSLSSLMESWTEVSVQLFTRHQISEGAKMSLKNQRMLEMNTAIENYHAQCEVRLGGENGESAISEYSK